MSQPYFGEIKFWAGNYAPRGFASAAGQSLPISQNSALFSLLGTYYGGNGTSTFQLPDLRGRTAVDWGQGAGLTAYNAVGIPTGVESVALQLSEMPVHSHNLVTYNGPAASHAAAPSSGIGLSVTGVARTTRQRVAADSTMSVYAVGVSGGGAPHENRQPFLVLSAIIALTGIFPQRN